MTGSYSKSLPPRKAATESHLLYAGSTELQMKAQCTGSTFSVTPSTESYGPNLQGGQR